MARGTMGVRCCNARRGRSSSCISMATAPNLLAWSTPASSCSARSIRTCRCSSAAVRSGARRTGCASSMRHCARWRSGHVHYSPSILLPSIATACHLSARAAAKADRSIPINSMTRSGSGDGADSRRVLRQVRRQCTLRMQRSIAPRILQTGSRLRCCSPCSPWPWPARFGGVAFTLRVLVQAAGWRSSWQAARSMTTSADESAADDTRTPSGV